MDDKYSVLLVDDEDEIRGRILHKFSDYPKFQVVGSASNGVDALDWLELHTVDVVVTDIRMPFVDGIELARTIRRDYPTVKVAFISGFDEFEYARQAINLNIFAYLMKPVTNTDFSDFIQNLTQNLDEEHQALYNEEQLQQVYQEAKPLLIESYFRSLLFQDDVKQHQIDNLQRYGVNIHAAEYCILYAKIYEFNDIIALDIAKLKLLKQMDRLFHAPASIIHTNLEHHLVFLLGSNSLDLDDLASRLTEVIENLQIHDQLQVSFGISLAFADLTTINTAYSQASKAMQNIQFLSISDVVYYGDIQTNQIVPVTLSITQQQELKHIFSSGSLEDTNDYLSKIKSNYALETSLLDHQYVVIHIASILLEMAQSMNYSFEDSFDRPLVDLLREKPNLMDLIQFAFTLALDIRDSYKQNTLSQMESLIQNVITYLNKDYRDGSISMESVCRDFGISVSYLSSLFKKHTNTSFNKYLVQVRMENAKQLLEFTEKNISQIAQEIGYKDVYYFSHSFKKYTNQSPKEYRNDRVY